MEISIDTVIMALESKKLLMRNGVEYWMGRDIQLIIGYREWENFEKVIHKGAKACEGTGVDPEKHFRVVTKKVKAGSGAMVPRKDFFLSRYACYLVTMNGDPTKVEVAMAQTYFAVQTRKQEIMDQASLEDDRLRRRRRVKDANKNLASAAKRSGVQRFPVFQAAGYRGLYQLNLNEIKAMKGIAKKEDLLDRAGRVELAANEFRITQTEQKLIRDHVRTEGDAIETHLSVGSAIRKTIKKLGGTMPESLPAEPSIQGIEKKRKKAIKALPQPEPMSP